MKKSTLLAVTAICGVFTLTGCASKKEFTSADITPTSSTSAAAAAEAAKSAPATAVEKSVPNTAMTDASVASEDIASSAANAKQSDAAAKAKGTLDTVYFDFDAHLLAAEARETLSRNAALLNESKLNRVVIEGHADERGSDDYNLALAEKRAAAVSRYLESLGINAQRLEIISYGEDKPAVAGHDEAAWAKNRRVDFVGAK